MFFEYEVLMDELDSFNKGLIAYKNCAVVSEYYKRYQYTEHLRMLVGDEGFVSSVIEAGAKFIAWLKEKLTAIIKALKNFLTKIINKILVFLGFKPIGEQADIQNIHASWTKISKEYRGTFAMKSSIVVEIPYAIHDIVNAIGNGTALIRVFVDNEPVLGDEDSIAEHISTLKNVSNKIIEAVKKQPEGSSNCSKGPISAFRDILSKIFTAVDFFIEQLLRTADELDKFKSKVTYSMDIYQVAEASNTIKSVRYSATVDTDPKTAINDIIRIVTAYIRANANVVTRVMPALQDISTYFPVGPCQVHIERPIDQDLKRRMEGFFGGKLDVRSLILTSLDPRAWIVDTDNTMRNGWCYAGKDLAGSKHFYINYNAVLKYLDKHHGQLTKVAKELVKIVVHECRHLFDAQTGRDFDGVDVKYEDRSEEKRAYYAQYAFVITDHDIRWMENILREIEQMIH